MANPMPFSSHRLVQAFTVISAQGFSSVANFLMGVLLARACSKSEYGVYVQCIALLNIISGVQLSFAAYPYTILHPQLGRAGQKTFLGSILVLQLCLVGVVAFVFLATGVALAVGGKTPSLVSTTCLLSLAGPVFLMRDSATVMILARLQVWRNFLMVAGASLATMAGLAACYAAGRLTVPVAFLVFVACTGLPLLGAVYFSLWRDALVQTARLRPDLGESWRLGKWLIARTFANMVAISIFPFLLGSFHGAEDAAVYGVCITYANLLNPLAVGMASCFRPWAAHANATHPDRLGRMTLLCVSGLSALLAVFLAVTIGWGGTIVTAVFGPEYRGLDRMLVLAVLANSIWVLSGPVSIAIDVRERTDATFRGRLVGCAVSVVFGLVLVERFSSLGAVAALALSWAGTSVYWLREFLLLTHSRQEVHHARAAVPA